MTCTRVEEWRGAYRVLVAEPEGKKKHGGIKRECEDIRKNGCSRSGMGA
jgi:hypothetical protein